MRKNLVNKKVVSSIGIGIMAFVTATSPTLTVLAEEVDTAPAPEPAPVVETNTPAPQAQGQTEPAPSEQSQAVDSAQTAVSDAQVQAPANDTLAGINQALDNANQALGNIAGNVTELDNANQAVNNANQTLADGMAPEGYEEEIDAVEGAADTVDEKVGSLTEAEVDESVTSAKEKADSAEEAAEKTHEDAKAAEDAKKQVEEDLAKVEETDGVLDKVESAEEALDQVGTQVTILQGVLEANQTAKDAADTAAGNAETALNNVLSDGMKEMTDEAKEELQNKVQAVTDTQNSLQTALDVNKENIAALEDQVSSLSSINEAEKEELATLIGKLSEFDTLNEYEQEKYLDNLGKYTSVKILLGEEEKSIADWVNGYMGAYTAALQAHVGALETLVEQMNGLSDTLTDDAKNALANVNTALEAAKNYEKDSLAAYNQITEVTDAAVAVQRAQEELDANTNEEKEKLIADADKQKTDKENENSVQSTWDAYQLKLQEIEEIKQKDNAWWDVAGTEKAIALNKAEKEAKTLRDTYYKALDQQADYRIKYLLMDEGATNIVFNPEGWESGEKERNHRKVTYDVYDEEGNKYTRTEYFDYEPDETDGTVPVILRKEAKYEVEKSKASFTVSVNRGTPTYKLTIDGEEKFVDASEVTRNEDGSYQIDGVVKRTEKFTVNPKVESSGTITVTIVTEPGKETKYTYSNKLGEYSLSAKDLIYENGILVGVKIGAFDYKEDFAWLPSIEEPVRFNHEGNFSGTIKGDSCLNKEEYDNSVETYKQNKENSKNALDSALAELKKSVDKSDKLDDATKTTANTYLEDENKDSGKINNVVTTAVTSKNTAGSTWNTSKDVKKGVNNAYLGVVKAIQSLLDAMANRAETGNYDAIAEAVEKHQEASDKLDDPRFGDLKTARDTLEDVLGKTFRYNTPGTTPETPTTPGGGTGGTTGGGTGGTTGGGAGGTGGGAADAAIPAAAPVVNIPATAVPLAGPTVADAVDEDEDGAEGLTTLEDEVTPLAGPEEKDGAIDLSNFPMPGIGAVAKTEQMSWWWLLIIALFGATGAEMYRRHQKKQREEANIEN